MALGSCQTFLALPPLCQLCLQQAKSWRPGLGPRGHTLSPLQKWGHRWCLSSGCQSEVHETGCLKQQKLASPGSGDLKSKTEVPAGSDSACSVLYTATFLACPQPVERGPSCSHRRTPHPEGLTLVNSASPYPYELPQALPQRPSCCG